MGKFKAGDATDQALTKVIHHEFLRCDDAFNEFAKVGEFMILHGENRRLAYQAYNAYARFVHHLYEFALAAAKKDLANTDPFKHPKYKKHEMADLVVGNMIQRIVTNRREAILQGRAPVWENHISAYPEKIPADFASEFRQVRNAAHGHALHERAGLSLTEFYGKYHMYLYLLYAQCKYMWGTIGDEFPDLGEITAFSLMVKETVVTK